MILNFMRLCPIIGVILAILVCSVFGSCSIKNTNDFVKKEMLAFMQDKYGEEFSFIEYYGSHIGSATRTAYVSSATFPDAHITVTREVDDDGTVTLSDDYPLFLYEDDIERRIVNITKGVYGDCRVFYVPRQSSACSTSKLQESLSQFITAKQTKFAITILIYGEPSKSERNNNVRKLRLALKDANIRVMATILYTDDMADFDLDEEEILRSMSLEDRYIYVGSFSMGADCNFLHLRWR